MEEAPGPPQVKDELSEAEVKQEPMEVDGKKPEVREEEEAAGHGAGSQSTSPSQPRKKSMPACLPAALGAPVWAGQGLQEGGGVAGRSSSASRPWTVGMAGQGGVGRLVLWASHGALAPKAGWLAGPEQDHSLSQRVVIVALWFVYSSEAPPPSL